MFKLNGFLFKKLQLSMMIVCVFWNAAVIDFRTRRRKFLRLFRHSDGIY